MTVTSQIINNVLHTITIFATWYLQIIIAISRSWISPSNSDIPHRISSNDSDISRSRSPNNSDIPHLMSPNDSYISHLKTRNNSDVPILARGKPEYPEKNLSEEGREPTTDFNSNMASDLTLEGGECSHHCTTLLPQGKQSDKKPYPTLPYTPFSFHRGQYATVTALFHSASCPVLVTPVSWFSINSPIFFVINLKQNYWSLTFLCVDETLWCYYW